jgi:hypothetical protein
LRSAVSRHLTDRSRALLARFEDDHVVRAGDQDPAVRTLIAGLGDLQAEVAALVQERVAAIVTVLTEGVGGGDDLGAVLAEIVDADLAIPVTRPSAVRRGRPGEGMLQTQTVYMGTMMGKQLAALTGLATAIGALTPAGWAVAAGIGLTWAYLGLRTRNRAAGAAARRAWAQEAVTRCVQSINAEAGDRITDALYEIRRRWSAHTRTSWAGFSASFPSASGSPSRRRRSEPARSPS